MSIIALGGLQQVRRWKLQRMMNAEIEELAAKLMPKVSPDAVF